MSDNDLIRRGDALRMASTITTLAAERFRVVPVNVLHTLPAVQPTASPDVAALVDALEYADRMVRLDLIHMTDFDCDDFSQAVVDTGERIKAALARVKSKEGFSDEKGVM